MGKEGGGVYLLKWGCCPNALKKIYKREEISKVELQKRM